MTASQEPHLHPDTLNRARSFFDSIWLNAACRNVRHTRSKSIQRSAKRDDCMNPLSMWKSIDADTWRAYARLRSSSGNHKHGDPYIMVAEIRTSPAVFDEHMRVWLEFCNSVTVIGTLPCSETARVIEPWLRLQAPACSARGIVRDCHFYNDTGQRPHVRPAVVTVVLIFGSR